MVFTSKSQINYVVCNRQDSVFPRDFLAIAKDIFKSQLLPPKDLYDLGPRLLGVCSSPS